MMARRDPGELFARIATAALIAAIVLAGVLLARTISELGQIYARRAFDRTRTARLLWLLLAALMAVWVVAAVMATTPAWQPTAVYLSAWAFFAFVLLAEGLDHHARRRQQQALGPAGELDSYLSFTPAPPGSNGQQRELTPLS